ncbi:g637 [Coccomyxa elongata]
MTTLHKAGIVGIAVYIASRMVKKPPSQETSIALAVLAGGIVMMLDSQCFREGFATGSTPDEAGLVFGALTSTSSPNALLYYSGNTMSLLSSDKTTYLGIALPPSTQASVATVSATAGATSTPGSSTVPSVSPTAPNFSTVTAVQMNAMAETAGVLPNLRIVLYQQTTFDVLQTVRFSDMVNLLHNDESGGDRYITVATSGVLTCGNRAPPTGSVPNVFKLVDATDPTNTSGIVSLQSAVYLQYVGDNAGPASFIAVGAGGTLTAGATQGAATQLLLSDCLSACASPNWRWA